MGYAAYRLRVNQLLAVERMRNAISADLHDEIGSSLTRIAVGLEVTRQRLGSREREVSESLGHVAGLARDTTSSMANIVWAVNPLHDSLGSLTARIRRFSTEVLEASDIECKVTAPESEAEMKLDIESRGQIFLIVKEAVHNAVRHARPTAVEIELRVESGAQRLGYGAPQYMTLRISDNGSGFDEARIQPGHGLSNMRARAERLKGKLTVTASPGSGCTIELRVPLRH
jgi:signal transduction histidine kinase